MSRSVSPVRVGAWSAWFPVASRHMLVDARGRDEAATPDVSFLPLTQRKRLSLLSKTGLFLADRTVSQSPHPRAAMASVFATRYGECQRTYSILEGIARETAPTPAAFSSSVHNTTSGLWSIAAQSHLPSTTVTAGDATLHAGLLEASGMCAESGNAVLFVYADVPLPQRYGSEDKAGAPTGFAAIIESESTREDAAPFDLSFAPKDESCCALSAVAQVAGLVDLLTGSVTKFRACDGRITWNLASA